MKTSYVSFGVLTGSLLGFWNQNCVAQNLPHPTPVISHVIPKEVAASVDTEGKNPIAVFDDFSWRSFVALNWPAAPSTRGTADTSKKIGEHADGVPVVWETWKADYELFQDQGAPPTEWSSFDALTPCKETPFQNSGKTKVLASFSKFGDFNQAGLGNLLGPLVAQNRTYVRYEVRVNREEFDFLRDNKLYLKKNFPAPGAPKLRFPDGSIEIKAAWRMIKAEELPTASSRYYVSKAIVLDPVQNVCEEKHVALVGFHIVQKTPLRPQWIWSSFEHIDNVPEFGGVPDAQRRFSFNDPASPQRLNPEKSPAPISETNPPKGSPDPMQVVRQKDLDASTKVTNEDYRKLLKGTVWENYVLVMTQWPTQPIPEDSIGAPFPVETMNVNLANTTMETYFQIRSTQSPPNTRAIGCMKCHDIARDKGTDFVWFMHLRAFAPGGEPQPEALKVLKSLIE